uniref:Zinc knuckle CX2CX4HX4C n=1 Tax=Tanacetum cinerariifolium TaxID=118510 RepID=A0A699ILT8_TANCI|nr:zinc knuckle CX2CX4HX4C [Tanacetum cinerariifolium]
MQRIQEDVRLEVVDDRIYLSCVGSSTTFTVVAHPRDNGKTDVTDRAVLQGLKTRLEFRIPTNCVHSYEKHKKNEDPRLNLDLLEEQRDLAAVHEARVAAIYGLIFLCGFVDVPLTTVGDLHKLINDIEAGKHNELLSWMTIDDRMKTMDTIGTICKLVKAVNNNADVSPCKVSQMDTTLLKEELTRIPIWVKLHDVPIQVFEEDDISLISTFARCLIEVNSEADLVDVVTISILSLSGDGFTKETIRVEYEWRPPRCDICKIFNYVYDHCPKKVVSPPIVTTSNVVTHTIEKTNDGFQTVSKKKKMKATTIAPKKRVTNVSNTSQSTSMLKTTGYSSKKYNLFMSNSFSALNDEEEDDEDVQNVYDKSANLLQNTKTSEISSFMANAG